MYPFRRVDVFVRSLTVLLVLGSTAVAGPDAAHGTLAFTMGPGRAAHPRRISRLRGALYPPDGSSFGARVAAGTLVQVALWYMVVSGLRRSHRKRTEPSAGSPPAHR